MNGIAVLLAMAAVGIDYGWQPTPEGQLEYIIQIEPNLLDSLRNGRDIVSKIPPEARGVRQFRIHVGTGPVPRIAGNSAAGVGDGRTGNTPNLDPGALARRNPDAAGNTGSGMPLLDLPPPPWTNSEQRQLRSVLVRNGHRGSADSSISNSPGPGYSTNTSATDSILPTTPAPPSTGSSSFPTNTNATRTAPTIGIGTGAYDTGNRNMMSTPSPTGPQLGPPGPAAPRSDEILPKRRPISSPGSSGTRFPIRDPQARSRRLAPGVGTTASGATKKSRHSKLMDLVRQNTAPTNAIPGGTEEASSKPVIDKATADKLVAQQAEKPWMPLVLTSLALFASLAANLYLGWIAIGVYRRYRHVVAQLRDAAAY